MHYKLNTSSKNNGWKNYIWKRQCIGKKSGKELFILYSAWAIKIELASCRKIGTGITAFLPTNSSGFLTSKFRGDEINELFHGKQRLWVEILNKPFEDHIEIKKGQPLGFLVVEPENLKFQHVPPKKKKAKK